MHHVITWKSGGIDVYPDTEVIVENNWVRVESRNGPFATTISRDSINAVIEFPKRLVDASPRELIEAADSEEGLNRLLELIRMCMMIEPGDDLNDEVDVDFDDIETEGEEA